LRGIIPNVWVRPSSGKTDVFAIISTVSMAKTGTPFKKFFLMHLHVVMEFPSV